MCQCLHIRNVLSPKATLSCIQVDAYLHLTNKMELGEDRTEVSWNSGHHAHRHRAWEMP